ncbi:hypothetical protein H6503_04675 [Candidatus Woesearchaeota archaeon]|nr:hypothetical protein [Candidatus Woesearchaeota archaeon]
MVDLKRLAEYGVLLAKGSARAYSQVEANLKRKQELLHQWNKEEFSAILEDDIRIAERVERWIDSKENKTAYRLLQKIKPFADQEGFGHDMRKILSLGRTEDRLIRKIVSNLKLQRKKSNKGLPIMTKLLSKQQIFLERLYREKTNCKGVFTDFRNAYFSARAKIATSLTFLATLPGIASAGGWTSSNYNPFNPANPAFHNNLRYMKNMAESAKEIEPTVTNQIIQSNNPNPWVFIGITFLLMCVIIFNWLQLENMSSKRWNKLGSKAMKLIKAFGD